MERNKMEDDFRKKLGQREIQPSEGAWDRLDAMLAVAEGKKKRDFRWLYIAAGFLGFALIVSQFFGSSEEMTDKGRGIVVNEQPVIKPDTTPHDTTLAPHSVKQQFETVAESQTKKPVRVSPGEKNPVPSTQRMVAPAVPTAVAQNESKEIINQKTLQVAPKPVSVDAAALLASVENRGTLSVPLAGKEKVKVNATSLLSQVDGELELTFREKALRTVSRNYQNVKVALSNRNNE